MSSRAGLRLLARICVLALLGLFPTVSSPALAKAPYEIDHATLEARYADADSRFVEIDGVRLHYKDQGRGPVVVLVHASFLNLDAWTPVARELAATHRVIRFDMLTNGLTGDDPAQRYSIERNLEMLAGLLKHLGIDRHAIIGTSSGGIVAFRHAAAHPDTVERLILINSAGMPRTAATNPNRPRGSALRRWIEARYKSRSYWQDNLEAQFTGGTAPDPAFVTRTYDMNRRAGLREAGAIYLRNFRTGDPQSELAKVRAPTLVAWGIGNLTVSHLEADVMVHWLTGAPSLLVKYPKLGHYAYLEDPARIAADMKDFLLGRRDAELRVTQRISPACVAACTP